MNDLTIIEELSKGNEAALKQLFLRFEKPVSVFVYQLVKNREVTEEIVGDVFMKVWDKRQDFESVEKLRSFLYVAGRNACYNYLKSVKKVVIVEEPLEFIGDLSGQGDDTLKKIIRTELLHAIFEKAAKMPAKQRAIFNMIFKEDCTVEEICKTLTVTPAAVYTNRSRAVQYLKSTLGISDLTFFMLIVFSLLF